MTEVLWGGFIAAAAAAGLGVCLAQPLSAAKRAVRAEKNEPPPAARDGQPKEPRRAVRPGPPSEPAPQNVPPPPDEKPAWTVVQAAARAMPDRLRRHVEAICSFAPRDIEHPENLDKAAAYILEAFTAAGGRVSEQTYVVRGRVYRNVLASFGPEKGARTVVGAHYDAFGHFPGADDNASGVAGLLELARWLGETPPPRRVDLAAYTLEEPPAFRTDDMGSHVHAESLRREKINVRLMICLEMIGYFSDAPESQAYPAAFLKSFYPSRGQFIALVGREEEGRLLNEVERAMTGAAPLPVRSLRAPLSLGSVDLSDHINFWDAGYPAVMITDTAFYRNPGYHREGDKPDTLDYEKMSQVVAGVYAAVVR